MDSSLVEELFQKNVRYSIIVVDDVCGGNMRSTKMFTQRKTLRQRCVDFKLAPRIT